MKVYSNIDMRGNRIENCLDLANVLYEQKHNYHTGELVVYQNKVYSATKNFTSSNSGPSIDDDFAADLSAANLQLTEINGVSVIREYAPGAKYAKDEIAYLGTKVVRIVADYTANNSFSTPQECLEDDLKNNKVVVINTDHTEMLREYVQLNQYKRNTLVYCGTLVARVLADFTADTTGATVEDSFNVDITAGYLTVLNKEAESMVLPYQQNILFSKGKIVYTGNIIGSVVNDYISDSTAATALESINLDIVTGKIEELSGSYKFKLYHTTEQLAKDVNAITTLPITSIVFEPGESVAYMKKYEGVYGPLGTIALITNIDVNLGLIDVKTVTCRDINMMPAAPNVYRFNIALQGSGYIVSDVLPTSVTDVFVEVTSVNSSGSVTGVKLSEDTVASTLGSGAVIETEIIYHVGNGKSWYELPKTDIIVRDYKQGEVYDRNELIVLGPILAKSVVDFTSDSTLPSVDDSFKYDQDNGNLVRLTKEDIQVPECLGAVKTDTAVDLPTLAIKGNWVLIENCTNTSPGQAGIGLYNGTSWDINLIPQGTFTFPEPNDDSKLYFRTRVPGDASGQWSAFTEVDGDKVDIIINKKSDITDNTFVPQAGELVWDTSRQILVIGDGVKTLGNLKEFYGQSITSADILAAIGYTPEDAADKGQANGYAPLDASGIVPIANLPAALTNTYSKTEIDTKDADTLTAATALVNAEASRASTAEAGLQLDIDNHIANTAIHVTQTEKDAWNDKVDLSDLTNYDNHLSDTVIHVTQTEKDKWDGMNKAYYVTQLSNLPSTGNQIGNIGYVQVSAPGVTPVSCDQYLWDGATWKLLDANRVAISFTWGNLQGKPASTPLSIDNTVTVAHNHINRTVLDKIGQSAAGNFTYDGIEIGVRVIFLANENLLPALGQEDTLYVIYEDSRVRNYPSISVYKDGAYQILGRGTQDTPAVVGDMSILQSEYFSVAQNASYKISVTPNQFFAFMPVEILREIEGLKNQTKIILDINDPANFDYDENMLTVNSTNKLTISIKDRDTTLDTVSNFYYSHLDINLGDFKDVDSIE